ncbi:MAG: 1-acyl-sn-glycerol-3-phosphate acyltransferase [Clostridia bacterium]|nr:1-acyl-sn-glycerol-3-phosphate acyltransferase [Clostridia bacterium]
MSREEKKKSGKVRRVKKPPALIWYAAFIVISLFYRIRYRVRVRREAGRIKGPAVILAPHVSGKDHYLVGMAAFPERPNFVLSEHFMAMKALRPVLKMIRAIPKKMYCADPRAVIGIKRAVRDGRTVVLFPEGRLTWYSRSLRLTDGTAELIKQLGVNVYLAVSDGAGLSVPKWAKFKRRGRIEVRTSLLLSSQDVGEKSVAELRDVISRAIKHDDELSFPDTVFRAPRGAYAEGLGDILWICPSCLGEGTLGFERDRITCGCGMSATVDGHGRVYGLGHPGIKGVADWYEWCASRVDTDKPFSFPCRITRTDDDGYMEKISESDRGVFTITRDTVAFEGRIGGADVSFSDPTGVIKGFPVSVGEHFDLYHQNRLHYVYPDGPGYLSVKAVSYLERVTKAAES